MEIERLKKGERPRGDECPTGQDFEMQTKKCELFLKAMGAMNRSHRGEEEISKTEV